MQFLGIATVIHTYENTFFKETSSRILVRSESWHTTTSLEIPDMEILFREWQNSFFQSTLVLFVWGDIPFGGLHGLFILVDDEFILG
jgi:hypothetical protein